MKSIVAVLSVLMGCSAVAQSVKTTTLDTSGFEPQLIDMEEITAPGVGIYPNLPTTSVASNSIADPPNPMPPAASIGQPVFRNHAPRISRRSARISSIDRWLQLNSGPSVLTRRLRMESSMIHAGATENPLSSSDWI